MLGRNTLITFKQLVLNVYYHNIYSKDKPFKNCKKI